MDRCLIHQRMKLTCHSYSCPLHNSSICYSTRAQNVSFTETPLYCSCVEHCVLGWQLFILCLRAAGKETSSRTQQGLRSLVDPPLYRQWWISSHPHTPTYLPTSCPPFWHWAMRPTLTLQRLANVHQASALTATGGEMPAADRLTLGRTQTHADTASRAHPVVH